MAKQTSTQTNSERIITIPLREALKKSERKRANYAVRYVRSFIQKQTKAEDVKLGAKLNEAVWARGMKKPPRSVRVKMVKDGNIVKAELVGFDYQEFSAKPRTEKKGAKEKLMERLGPKALKKEEEEKMIEGSKKAEAAKHVERHEVGEGA